MLAGALGTGAGRVTVIFDAAGAPRHAPAALEHRGIQVRFARNHDSADEAIGELIRSSGTPRNLTVISDDQAVVRAALRRGCATMTCEAFLKWLHKQYRRTASRLQKPDEKTQRLSGEELRRWLQEFSHLDEDPALGRPFPFEET
jgi:hypothetical protein